MTVHYNIYMGNLFNLYETQGRAIVSAEGLPRENHIQILDLGTSNYSRL